MSDSLVIPPEWSWEAPGLVENFDQHVREQLPWYDWTTTALVEVVRNYLPKNGTMYDIGASTGNIELACRHILDARGAKLIAVEPSSEMRSAYRGRVIPVDSTAEELQVEPFDVAVFMLTLCFIAPEDRAAVTKKFRHAMRRGGAMIFVERMEPPDGYPAIVLQRVNWALKMAAGSDPGDVLRKDMSLGGIQRPVRPWDLPEDAVEWFRLGDFAGWIAEA
jgi:tRNA (cmo5U34)-methyltransferase